MIRKIDEPKWTINDLISTLSQKDFFSKVESEGGKMYAIVFDFDTESLKKNYHNESYQNAYTDIKNFLVPQGFEWTQGSVYFGKKAAIDAATCVVLVQKLARKYDWFSTSIRDIRMLRIEESNNLLPAVKFAVED